MEGEEPARLKRAKVEPSRPQQISSQLSELALFDLTIGPSYATCIADVGSQCTEPRKGWGLEGGHVAGWSRWRRLKSSSHRDHRGLHRGHREESVSSVVSVQLLSVPSVRNAFRRPALSRRSLPLEPTMCKKNKTLNR